ncbi:hypothetical protein [Chlamydia suis]|uniref:hypothetical protein n=1 Tax=Chlamydia suis TaxID=83559 RepID=UPI002B3F0D7C|nr:hypothetical protein [Chlamydia suis]MEB2794792.1 hypothetical protein [Chlamydia suis]
MVLLEFVTAAGITHGMDELYKLTMSGRAGRKCFFCFFISYRFKLVYSAVSIYK